MFEKMLQNGVCLPAGLQHDKLPDVLNLLLSEFGDFYRLYSSRYSRIRLVIFQSKPNLTLKSRLVHERRYSSKPIKYKTSVVCGQNQRFIDNHVA